MKFIFSDLVKRKTIIFLYAVLVIAATMQAVLIKKKVYVEGGNVYTHYNNYVIFKQSYFHLLEGKDLYQPYPEEHWDMYKYSPTFAFCFGVLANVPDALGLGFWNLINAFILLISFFYLPKITEKHKIFIPAIVVLELMTSMQHQESNALITGLIVLAFGLMERKKYFIATLFIIITIYIKLFGIVAIALFIFYPDKRKLILYTLFWSALLLLMPLITVPAEQLKFLYGSWLNLILHDHTTSYGYSVMGWLHSWFNIDVNKLAILLTGAVLFLVPHIKTKNYKQPVFRMMTLASILLWVVIFNHRAESPSFIIAMSGIGIWFFVQEQNRGNIALMIAAFISVSLLSTDLFPKTLRKDFLDPYVIKAVPCILIWLKIIYDMTFNKKRPVTEESSDNF